MPDNANQPDKNSDAVFLGWQDILEKKPIALYIITAADHPSYGSSVSEDTLRKFNLQVPPIPPSPEGMK